MNWTIESKIINKNNILFLEEIEITTKLKLLYKIIWYENRYNLFLLITYRRRIKFRFLKSLL